MSTRPKSLEVRKILNGEFVWNFKGSNGQTISHGETYKRKGSALDGAILGSPVDKVDEEAGTIVYTEHGEQMEGKYIYIEETELLESNDEIVSTASIEQIKNASGVVNMIGAGLTVLDDGHLVLNNHIYHPKHPDQDTCAIPFCMMLMEVTDLIGSGE